MPPHTRGLATATEGGISRLTAKGCGLAELLAQFTLLLGGHTASGLPFFARVTAPTDLPGRYDFSLEYAGGGWLGGGLAAQDLFSEDVSAAPPLATALEKTLGLRLKKTSVRLDALIVDRVERVPVGN